MDNNNSGFFASLFKIFCCKASKPPSNHLNKRFRFFDDFLMTREILSITISDVSKTQKLPFGEFEIEVYSIKVKVDDYEFFIEKKFQDFVNFKEKLAQKIALPVFLELPEKIFNARLDEDILVFRQEKLNIFLHKLTQIFKETACIEIFEFLEIYENYEKKEVFLESSFNLHKLKAFYLTKDDAELVDLLVKLNTFPNNRIQYFKKIKEFILEKQSFISSQIKEVLINGFYELLGLIDICGQYTTEPHVICCTGLDLLYSLCDYEQNKEADVYINLFAKLSAKDFSKLNLGAHIVQMPAKNCKKLALKLLKLYREANPQANTFLLSQILNNDDAYNEYEKWKSGSTIISQKTEFFEVDVEECKVSTLSLMISNMNIGRSEGQKKLRSTLYRKKKKDRLLIPVRNQSN